MNVGISDPGALLLKMSAAYVFFTHPLSAFANKVKCMLALKNVPHEVRDCDLMNNRPPELFEASSRGLIPVLKVTRGEKDFYLGESFHICKYLDNVFPEPRLYPATEGGDKDVLLESLMDHELEKFTEELAGSI